MSAYSQLSGLYMQGTGPNLPDGYDATLAVPPYPNASKYIPKDNYAIPN
jgi:hypothetical protein